MVARLARTLGSRHLGVAEDAVQDALVAALQQWPFRGVPDQPEAWLYLVAKHRALDRLRHLKMASDKEPALALKRYPLLPAVQAELWREAGDTAQAAACYRAALSLARSTPEQCWLTARLSHLV